MCCLALSAGRRGDGRELYRRVWGGETENADHIVEINISCLRKRLGWDSGGAFAIVRTQGRAYVFRKIRF